MSSHDIGHGSPSAERKEAFWTASTAHIASRFTRAKNNVNPFDNWPSLIYIQNRESNYFCGDGKKPDKSCTLIRQRETY